MPRKNATVSHVVDRRPTSIVQIPGPPEDAPPHRESAFRLSYNSDGSEKRSIAYPGLARTIRLSSLPDTAFFVDTCFVNAHEVPTDLWDALAQQLVVVTPGILFELREWLDEPRRNGL